MHNTWEFYEGGGSSIKLRLRLEMDLRLYSPGELAGLLGEAGWLYLHGLGTRQGEDFQFGPLACDSRTMWLMARAG